MVNMLAQIRNNKGFIYTFISAYIGVTHMNEIRIYTRLWNT